MFVNSGILKCFGSVLSSDEEVMDQETVCKVPVLKRKQTANQRGFQAKKGAITRGRGRQQEEQGSDAEMSVEEEEEERRRRRTVVSTVTLTLRVV